MEKIMINKKLVLENGKEFYGFGFGSNQNKIGPIIYNTAMVGYQEVLSDPAMSNSIVLMSYPLIGNYGLNDEDYESKSITTSGFIVREYNDFPSNFRYTNTLGDIMKENNVAGIYNIDTRELTNVIRKEGSLLGMICAINKPLDECLKEIKAYTEPNYTKIISCQKIWHSKTTNPLYNVVVIDCGVKLSMIKYLNQIGCNVSIVPYESSLADIMKLNPHGVVISSGPGNPNKIVNVINLIKSIVSKVPILAIGLGAQLGILAMGGSVDKLLFGRNGKNHPCKNVVTNKINIVSQSYMYEINKDSLKNTLLKPTYINVLDNSVVGLKNCENKIILVQFDPLEEIYNEFINLMNESEELNNA